MAEARSVGARPKAQAEPASLSASAAGGGDAPPPRGAGGGAAGETSAEISYTKKASTAASRRAHAPPSSPAVVSAHSMRASRSSTGAARARRPCAGHADLSAKRAEGA